MKKGVNKRGLSPVVASVLLILLVVVLASMIFFWARGFIGEQIEKFGNPVDKYCERVDFKVERIVGVGGDDVLEVLNRGDVDIHDLEIKMIGDDGNSRSEMFGFSIDAGGSNSGSFNFDMEGDSDFEVVVYPTLLGSLRGKSSNRVYTCLNSGVTL